MIDFSQKISNGKIEKKIIPIEIYDNLDRRSETGPLRPSQESILSSWYKKYKDRKNIIIKLHTGEGKTLIGLLLLLSKMHQDKGPALYICPNIYLVKQTCLEAEKFGIPFCTIDGYDLPCDFLSSKKILITHIQKVFTGSTIFGLKNRSLDVGAVVLDDSHACIDSIKDSFTIKFDKTLEIYSEIISLFEEDLREQGEGTFLDIKNNDYSSLLPIPYWSWIDKSSELIELLAKKSGEDYLKYVWPIIKNDIKKCQGFISGNRIEISPIFIPMQYFGSFHNATHRVLMSATTQDDSFFVKGLGFSIDDVENPLTSDGLKWSGEKLILIPSLISEDLDRDLLVTNFAPKKGNRFGIVSIIPSFKMAKQYENIGAVIANSKNIYELVGQLKSKKYSETIVFVNRYDGIDLPDDACRILIIDSKPFLDTLKDRYEEYCRPTSDIINAQIAQKIEQGLGRSVRGEKDYSVVIIIGGDLVSFIKSPTTKKYFSDQMQKQIEIGLNVSDFAKEEIKDDQNEITIINNLIKQVTNRDEGWKIFYKSEMNKMKTTNKMKNTYELLTKEYEAEAKLFLGDYEEANSIMQNICDKICSDELEKGWYLQKLAHITYFQSKIESNAIQKNAFINNFQVLKPKEGISYKKIEYKNDNRTNKIKKHISQFSNFQDLSVTIDGLMSDLSFGMEAEKFESSLQKVGMLLGFTSQRPDKEFRKGPDNLWCISNNSYIMFECKNEVLDDRVDINKYEAGQMNSHCGWFEKEYKDANVNRFLIIPTKSLSYYANFTHEVKIIRKGMLIKLKNNIKSFIREFKPYILNGITCDKIEEFIISHNLDNESLKTSYCENYYHKSNQKEG